MGVEIAGIVEEIGEGTDGKFKKGDRVFGLVPGGGYAQYCAIPSSLALSIPENLSFEEAASIPEAFLTAFQSLFWLGEIPFSGKDPKTILIHAGASGVGASAIQLAKQISNIKVIGKIFKFKICETHFHMSGLVTCGSPEKMKFCLALGGK